MLAIRMQRTGRKGHSQFRVIVQESRLSPSSGKVVAFLGNYDPHTKATKVDTEKASFYLEHGAQPSDRVALLLQKEGVKLPTWVTLDTTKKGDIKKPEKLRRNNPVEKAAPVVEEVVTESHDAEEVATSDAPAEEVAAEVAPESPAVEVEPATEEAPAVEVTEAEAVAPETPAVEV